MRTGRLLEQLPLTLSCLLVIGVSEYVQANDREVVKFDFAWRFHLGDLPVPETCSVNAFTLNKTGVQCKGLSRRGDAGDKEACRLACCSDANCGVWQFAEPTWDEFRGCWTGVSDDCDYQSDIWVGGGRDTPAKPPPPATSGPTSRTYNDQMWEIVDVPHDGIISGNYSRDASSSHGYLPFNITWYRKHFYLPSEWKGSSVWIYFEGVFHHTSVYLNGEKLAYHESGYTSFHVRLDNTSVVFYGNGSANKNVLAVRADSDGGSGWWYEGGGIYRNTWLVRSSPVHLVPDGIYAAPNVTLLMETHLGASITSGMGTVSPWAEVVNDRLQAVDDVRVIFLVADIPSGHLIGNVSSRSMTLPPGQVVRLQAITQLHLQAQLWTPHHPYLYQLLVRVLVDGEDADSVLLNFGFRHTQWTADKGFFLNNEQFIWRGFCNHNDFSGVGVAVPDRLNLFRVQMLRAVGGNSWRMSHNPPTPLLLDLLDRLGVVVWDENRQFGVNSGWVRDERDMVRRDRNHPSIMTWSFCNEKGCVLFGEEEAGEQFKNVTNEEDPLRLVAANMIFEGALSGVIDIQGYSHRSGITYDLFHDLHPNKPLIGSECCSCRTQRSEDVADIFKPNFGSFNADCLKKQLGWELDREYVAGALVWTLFDYYGEPTPYNWPMVSSSFGAFDLAGFAKAACYWYRSWWLYSLANSVPEQLDVPRNPAMWLGLTTSVHNSLQNSSNHFLAHIVEHWEADVGDQDRTIHGYTNAPTAELHVNGESQGIVNVSKMSWAQWDNVQYLAGNITLTAMDHDKHVVAMDTVMTNGKPSKIALSLDAPNELTGTGSALLLDGQDAALLRATILDMNGNIVASANNNITFEVLSGPGRIIGVGNGDPSCHEPNKVTWRSAYHGLVRATVQVTEMHISNSDQRQRLLQIDAEGGRRTKILHPTEESDLKDGTIVVRASGDGLEAQVSIALSTNPLDGVLSVAEKWMKLQL